MCPAVILTDQTAWNIDLHKYFMSALLLKVGEASPFLFYCHHGWNFNNCKYLTDWAASFKKTEISFLSYSYQAWKTWKSLSKKQFESFSPDNFAKMASAGFQLIRCYFVVKGTAVSRNQNVAVAWASSYLQRKHFTRSSSDSYEKPPLVHYAYCTCTTIKCQGETTGSAAPSTMAFVIANHQHFPM